MQDVIPVPSSQHSGLQAQGNPTFPFLLGNIPPLGWLVREPEYGLGDGIVIQVPRQSITSQLSTHTDYQVWKRNIRKLLVHDYLPIAFT